MLSCMCLRELRLSALSLSANSERCRAKRQLCPCGSPGGHHNILCRVYLESSGPWLLCSTVINSEQASMARLRRATLVNASVWDREKPVSAYHLNQIQRSLRHHIDDAVDKAFQRLCVDHRFAARGGVTGSIGEIARPPDPEIWPRPPDKGCGQ